MRGLIAVLYLMFLGWAVSHWELDRLALEAGHKALRGLMREHAQISLEVTVGAGYLPPYLIPVPPAVLPGEVP